MKNLILVLFMLPLLSFAAAPGVDTGGDRGTTYSKGQDIQRTKQLSADQSSSALNTKQRQKLRSQELSRTQLSQYTTTSEMPLSAILVPAIASVEMALQGKDGKELNYLQYIMQQCQLYSGSVAIPTAFPYKQPGSYIIKGGVPLPGVKNWLVPAEEPTHGFVKEEGLAILNWSWSMNKSSNSKSSNNAFARLSNMEQVSDAIGQKVDNPAMPLRCYYVYAKLGEAVINDLMDWSVGFQKANSGKDASIFLGEDLNELVPRVFHLRVLFGLDKQDEIERFVVDSIHSGCRLPTLTGVFSNDVGWRCGGITVDPLTDKATMGSMTLLDQNVYFGKSATITQVNEMAMARAYLSSDTEQVSKIDTRKSEQSTSMSKSSTNSSKSQTDLGTSSSTGVGSSGGN
jgi:hypothetical protein